MIKNLPASAGGSGDMSSIQGRSPGGGNDNSLQYSCLENSMDREAWQASVYGVARVGHKLATKPPPELPKWFENSVYTKTCTHVLQQL